MNKSQFLKELEHNLRRLPDSDREDALRFYDEYISDAESEADAISALGSPSNVASQIIASWAGTGSASPDGEKADGSDADSKKSSGFKTFWIVFAAILAAPIAFPLLIIIIICIAALLVAIVAIVAAIILSGVAIAVAGIFCIIAAFGVIAGSFATFLMFLGTGLFAIGVGIALFWGIILLGKLCIKGLIRLMSNILRRESK